MLASAYLVLDHREKRTRTGRLKCHQHKRMIAREEAKATRQVRV
jgi:hypothetical protein